MKSFNEYIKEAKSVPLVRRGQGTSRVDTHPKRRDGKVERMYQADNEREYARLIVAADTGRRGNAYSVQGHKRRKTVTVVFDNDRDRLAYEKKMGIKESVELDERQRPTRAAVDKEFTKVTRSGRMDTMAAIKHVEKMFKIKDVKIEKDKRGKNYVISFQESVELDEASDPRIKNLSPNSINALISFVNVLGTAGGAWIDAQNLQHLMPKAVDDTIKKAEKAKRTMSSGGRRALTQLKKELGESVDEAISRPGRRGGMPKGADRGDDTKPLMIWLDKLEKELKKKRKSYDDVDADDAIKLYYKDTDPKKAARMLAR